MNRHQKPSLGSNRSAKIVSALAAAVLTWVQFHAVVSLAEEPPMAMAGMRSSEKVAQSSTAPMAARVALAASGERPLAR